MKYYNIIRDEKALIDFINWLPELTINEKFIVSLFARKKYAPELKSSDKRQLRRFTADKEYLLELIKQLEVPYGSFKLKGRDVPQESLALYIMPNPRCMDKATEMLGKECWDLKHNKGYRLEVEALSCIQKCKSRTLYIDFDIDSKEIDLYLLNNIFPNPNNEQLDCYKILETRGGYHLLVRPSKATEHRLNFMPKNKAVLWHNEINKTFDIDDSGDEYMPVPGCTQGNFTPKFINI